MAQIVDTRKPLAATVTGILITLCLLVLCTLAPHYYNTITGQHITGETVFFTSRIAFWVLLLIVFFYCIKVEKKPLLTWPDEKRGILFYLISFPSIIAVIFVGAMLMSQLLFRFGLNDSSKTAQTLLSYNVWLKLLAIVTAGVVEEIIFRGYLISRLKLFFSSGFWPVIISAVFFGLAHAGYGTMVNMAIPLFIALVFGWHYYKYRNIKVLIFCHLLIDFYSLIIH